MARNQVPVELVDYEYRELTNANCGVISFQVNNGTAELVGTASATAPAVATPGWKWHEGDGRLAAPMTDLFQNTSVRRVFGKAVGAPKVFVQVDHADL